MHIGIDLSVLQGGSAFRGMGRNTLQLVNALLSYDHDNYYTLFHQPVSQKFPMLEAVRLNDKSRMIALPFQEAGLLERPYDTRKERAYTRSLSRFAADEHFDLLHLPCFDDSAYYYTPLKWEGCPLVMSVYDLIPYHYPERYLTDTVARDRYVQCLSLVRQAGALIANSETTRDEFIRYLNIPPDRIFAAPPYAEPFFRARLQRSNLQEIGIRGDYLYTITGMHHSKNIVGLLRIFANLIENIISPLQLVISANLTREQVPANILDLCRSLGIDSQIVWTGYVDDAMIREFYQGARAYVHASLEEGFGLPIVEAMQIGTPVIASARGAMIEAGGTAALLIDPLRPVEAAIQISQFLANSDKGEFVRAGFTQAARFNPTHMAQAGLAAYETAVRAPATPLDLPATSAGAAMWTPLPRQESGVGYYSESLLVEMSAGHRIAVVYTGSDADRERLARQLDLPVCAYGAYFINQQIHLHQTSVHLYHMGNNTNFHEEIYRQFQQEPGIVVLHDLSLFGFFSFLYWHRDDHRQMIRDVGYSHGDKVARQTEGFLKGTIPFDLLDVTMLRPILDTSPTLIVHSQFAHTFIKQKYEVRKSPIVTIPHGAVVLDDAPDLCSAMRKSLNLDASHFVIGVFGSIVPSKRVEIVLKAITQLLPTYPFLRLIVSGFEGSSYAQALHRSVLESDIAEQVLWIGEVGLEQFENTMRACDLVVNLRFPNNGEMSGTFMRALGMGKVVITSDLPQFAEFSSEFCWRIPYHPEDAEMSALITRVSDALEDRDALAIASAKAREFVEHHATWAIAASRVNEVIDRVTRRVSRIENISPKPETLKDTSIGVTLIGDLHGDYGHSQVSRSLVSAMREAGIALSYIEFAYDTSSRTTPFDDPPHGAHYPIQLFVCNAPQVLEAQNRFGADFFKGKYNIGYWFYELPRLPDDWLPAFDLLDEVWVSTRFVHDLTVQSSSIPVYVLPPPIEVSHVGTFSRRDFPGWDENRFTFLFSFSVLASSARKNPFGVIEAFRKACVNLEPSQLPMLILKAHFLLDYPQLHHALTDAIAGLPVLLITENMSREKTDALIRLSDAYISLHRSEGLGLGIAEALSFGKPVIATNWSGNVDFMSSEHCYPVNFQIIPISDDHHKFQESHKVLYVPGTNHWAEPDIDHAAERIKEVLLNPNEAALRGMQAARFMASHFNRYKRGAALRTRLESITSSRLNRPSRRIEFMTAKETYSQESTGLANLHQIYAKGQEVDSAFAQWDAIRLRDTNTRLSRFMRRIPLLGYLYRTLVRIGNLGHLEAREMYLFRAHAEHMRLVEDLLRDFGQQFAHNEAHMSNRIKDIEHQHKVYFDQIDKDVAHLRDQHADYRTFVQNRFFDFESNLEQLQREIKRHYDALDGVIAEVEAHVVEQFREVTTLVNRISTQSDAHFASINTTIDLRFAEMKVTSESAVEQRLATLVDELLMAIQIDDVRNKLADYDSRTEAATVRFEAEMAQFHQQIGNIESALISDIEQSRATVVSWLEEWERRLAENMQVMQQNTGEVRDNLNAEITLFRSEVNHRLDALSIAAAEQVSAVKHKLHDSLETAQTAWQGMLATHANENQTTWQGMLATHVNENQMANDTLSQLHQNSLLAQQHMERRLRLTTSNLRLLEQQLALSHTIDRPIQTIADTRPSLESGALERILNHLEHHLHLFDANTSLDISIEGSGSDALLSECLQYIGQRHRISQPEVWLVIDFSENWLASTTISNALSKPAAYGRTIILTDASYKTPVELTDLGVTFDRIIKPIPWLSLRVCVLQKPGV